MFNPDLMLGATRALELVFESLPESVLQSFIIFQLLQEGMEGTVSKLMMFSVLCSLFAAGFIMTDTSITSERAGMDRMYCGPKYHSRFHGLIPASRSKLICLYASLFCFYTFYLGTSMVTLTLVASTVHHPTLPGTPAARVRSVLLGGATL